MKGWHPATKLVALGGGLAVVLLLLTGENDSGTAAVAALPQAERMRVVEITAPSSVMRPAAVMPEKHALMAMVERPLFAPTRRPPEQIVLEQEPEREVAPLVVQSVMPEPEMSFVGSLVRDGTVLALVTRGYYGAVETIGLGGEIDGWKVLEIGDRALSLGLEDRRLEYRIFD